MTKDKRLADLLAEYPPSDPDSLPDDVPRYVLVERSVHDGSFYLTGHHSRRAAADYYGHQEYPNDWSIVTLVDLLTGKRFASVPNIHFEEVTL